MKKLIFAIILGVSLNAGLYTNQLIKCMVNNSSQENVKTLKTWLFFAFAQDKDLKPYSNISPVQEEKINKQMGEYVTKLLTQKCSKELRLAVKYEGKKSIPIAFEYLGRVAGSAITSSPNVKIFFSKFAHYVDMKKLSTIIQ